MNRKEKWADGASHLPNDAGLLQKALGMECHPVRAMIREFVSLVRREVSGCELPPD